MDLKEFIKMAIIDVISAVDEVKEQLGSSNSIACAPLGKSVQNDLGITLDANGRYHQNLEFDVAISVSSESITEGKINAKSKILVVGMEGAASHSSTKNNSTTSRLKFHVPIVLQCVKTT